MFQIVSGYLVLGNSCSVFQWKKKEAWFFSLWQKLKHREGRDEERKLSASSFSSLFCARMIYVLEKSKPTLVMWCNTSSCNVVVRFNGLTVYLSFCHVVFHASFQICPHAPSCVDACDGCGLGSNSCCVWSWPFLMVLLFLQALSSWSTTCLRWAFQIL